MSKCMQLTFSYDIRIFQLCQTPFSHMEHEYSNILSTTASPYSLRQTRRNQSTNSTQKSVVGNCIYELGRQEIAENLYALWSAYRASAPVRNLL